MIVVNDSNQIVVINAPARGVLNLDENHVAGKLVTDVIINQEVRDLLTHGSAASPQKHYRIILDDNRVFTASLTPGSRSGTRGDHARHYASQTIGIGSKVNLSQRSRTIFARR